jgi:6-phospho-beta-glucosidase
MSEGLFILGGSSIYIALLFDAMRRHQCFCYFDRITLYGRDQVKLAFNAGFGQRIVREVGANVLIDFTLELEDCLREEYTIIFNQIRFGGLQARDFDEKCAIKNQLLADETLGIVGVSNAIRSIILLRPILEIVANKQNKFLFLNFTNPCSIISQFIVENFHLNTIGICDYPNFYKSKINAYLGYKSVRVRLKYFGLNHFSFIYDILVDGDSVWAQFKEQDALYKPQFDVGTAFAYILIPSWENVFAKERVICRQNSKEGKNRAEVLLDLEKDFAGYIHQFSSEQVGTDVPSTLYKRNCEWYEIGLIPFFRAFLEGENGSENILNVDAGDVFNLGMKHCIVETNSHFVNQQPVCVELPGEIKKSNEFFYVKLQKMAENILLEAILAEDGNKVIESCLINPMIQDVDKVRKYFRELAQVDKLVAKFFKV